MPLIAAPFTPQRPNRGHREKKEVQARLRAGVETALTPACSTSLWPLQPSLGVISVRRAVTHAASWRDYRRAQRYSGTQTDGLAWFRWASSFRG